MGYKEVLAGIGDKTIAIARRYCSKDVNTSFNFCLRFSQCRQLLSKNMRIVLHENLGSVGRKMCIGYLFWVPKMRCVLHIIMKCIICCLGCSPADIPFSFVCYSLSQSIRSWLMIVNIIEPAFPQMHIDIPPQIHPDTHRHISIACIFCAFWFWCSPRPMQTCCMSKKKSCVVRNEMFSLPWLHALQRLAKCGALTTQMYGHKSAPGRVVAPAQNAVSIQIICLCNGCPNTVPLN